MSTSSVGDDVDRKPARNVGWRRFTAYLRQIKAVTILIAAGAGTISKVVIREQLVPEQLDWLADAGILVAMTALVVLPLYSREYLHTRKSLIVVLISSLAIILGVQASLIEQVPVQGATHRYLVGPRLTAEGRNMERNCLEGTGTKNLSSLSRYALLGCAGSPRIPELYGVGYTIVSVLYSAAYMLFLGIFVVLLGCNTQPNSDVGHT